MSWIAETRALDRRVWYLAIARMVVTAGFSMVMPFIAIHLAVERGVAAVTIGAIWTVVGALSAIAQWTAGEICDRVGRKPVMTTSMLLRAANLAGLGTAVAMEAPLVVIGALCVANGVLRAFFDPVATALVADLAPAERRVTAYSLQRVGINVGWAAGPAVAALAAGIPYSTLFYASVPVTLIAMLLVMRIDEPRDASRVREVSLRELLAFRGDRPFVRFLLSTLAFFILQVQLYQTLSIYAARTLGLSRAEVGTLYTLNGLLVVILQLPTSRLINQIGTRAALFVGCFGYAAAYAAVGLARGHLTLLACIAAVTLAEIVTAPAQQTAVTALAPIGRTGAYAGLYGLAQVVGQSTGPVIGTAFLDGLPARTAWFALACFGAAAAVGYRTVSNAGNITNNVLARGGPA